MNHLSLKQESLKAYFFSFISRYKIYLLCLGLIGIFAGIFAIAVEYKIKEIIDTIAANQTTKLGVILLFFVIYKLMSHGVYFLMRLLDIRYRPRIIQQTVTDMYQKTVAHSLHWFDSHLSGEISSKISDFQNSVSELLTGGFTLFCGIATILIIFFFLLTVNLFSAGILGIFVLVYTPVIYWLLKKQMPLEESVASARQKSLGVINDSITNIFGIKIIGNLSTEFFLKLNPSIKQWKHWDRKTRKFAAYVIDNVDTILVTLMSAAQIYLLAHLYQKGVITAGGFAFIAMMTLKIHMQLDSFLGLLLFNINPNIAKIRSSYAFVNDPIDVVDQVDAKILKDVKGEIHYKNVFFTYEEGAKTVFSNFSLSIQAGEKLGIVGTSGAGKTTLIKCLLRYFDMQQGSILIDGNDIKSVTQESLRKSISLIPQDISMFHRSIRENLKLAKYDATDSELKNACEKAKIHDVILGMPKGYDSIVGERGMKLSGGQRQRVAIARAILKNAPILILDEATSSLDTPTEALIQDSINELLETNPATVIAIAHRLSTLKHMDRIIVLEQGKIMEEGTHAQLIEKKDGFYRKLWEMQQYTDAKLMTNGKDHELKI